MPLPRLRWSWYRRLFREAPGRQGSDDDLAKDNSHIDPTEKKAAVQGMLKLIRGGAGKADGETEGNGGGQTGTSTGTCPSETSTSGKTAASEKEKAQEILGFRGAGEGT